MSESFVPRKMGLVATVALAGGLVAVAAIGSFGSPASASSHRATTTTVPATTTTTSPVYANQFRGQYADSTWTNSVGQTNAVRMTPGKDQANASITEYLTTTITGTFCFPGNKGFLLTTSLSPKVEQATDLSGVTLNTLASAPTATVARATVFTGSVTKTPRSGTTCQTARSGSAVTTTNPSITLNGSWSKLSTATLLTYSGTDCGGTGTCRYTDATNTGSIVVTGTTFTLGGTGSNKWLWSGNWNLSATCSPVPGYPCA